MHDSSSGVLTSLAAADHAAARRAAGRRRRRTSLAAQRMGPLVDGDRRAAGHAARPAAAANAATPSSKSRYTGPCRWSAGELGAQPLVVADGRPECGNSSSASTTATGCSKLARPESASGQMAPGRVDDVGVAEQDERVDALRRAIDRAHPVACARGASAPRSGCAGIRVGGAGAIEPGGHQPSSPR